MGRSRTSSWLSRTSRSRARARTRSRSPSRDTPAPASSSGGTSRSIDPRSRTFRGKVLAEVENPTLEYRLFVSPECFDLDVVVGNPQAPGQLQGSYDHAGRAADVVDRVVKPERRLLDKFPANPSRRPLPPLRRGAGKGVEHAEPGVLPFERIELVSIYDLVLAPVAVDEPDRDGQRFVGCIFGHALEGRDPDASRQQDRGPRFVQHEVADRAEDADLFAGLKGDERTLVRGVRDADRVFEVRARGTRRERHGARVHALLGLQLEERELGGTECEGLRLLDFDRARRRRELSRGHHLAPEAPRRTSQRNRSPATLEARPRLRYFVTPTE